MAGIWDQLVDAICRPPRDVYSPEELLGGRTHAFMVGNMEASRIDYELKSKLGQQIMVSHYLPMNTKTRDDKLPVVVYCHCNSGSRRDAEEAVWHLLPCGVGVVAFDFTGSGLSDGKWVTLGAHEVDDLAVVIDHLRTQGGVSSIGLWGRSMGAVTALLYSARDPDIAGMVLDSPFSRLTDLMLEIVVSQRLPIPKVMLKLALKLMRASVKRKAGADINAVAPLDAVGRSLIPAMFGHGREDSFIGIHHTEKLHEAYNSAGAYAVYKNIVRFDGDHNHPRPAFFYSSVCCFFHQQLKLDLVLLPGHTADTQQLLRHGSLNLAGEPPEQVDRANGFINTPWSFEGVTSLSDLAPEDRQAAAAALLLDDPAAAAEYAEAEPARVGSGSSSGSAGADGCRDGLNSPRAAGAGSRSAFSSPSRPTAGSSGSSMSPGGSRVAQLPAGLQQQQHQEQHSRRHRHLHDLDGLRAQLVADGFEVGSRGDLGAIPLPVAAGGPLGLSSSSNAAAAAAAGAAAGGSNSGSRSPAAGRRQRNESAPAGRQASSSSSTVRSSSPGAALLAAGGQQLKRLLLFRGNATGSNAAAATDGAAANGAAAGSDSSSVSAPQLPRFGTSPVAGDTATAAAGQRQQQQQGPAQAAAGADVLGPLDPESVQLEQQQQQQAPWLQHRQQRLQGTWALAGAAHALSAEDDLAAAIAASLQEMQQQQQQQQPLDPPAALGSVQPSQQQQQQQQQVSRVPLSLQEEEEMLQQAIALSLAELQQQERQAQPHQQPAADLPLLPLLQGQPGAVPLQLLQEQQSEQVSHLLVSQYSLDGDADEELLLEGADGGGMPGGTGDGLAAGVAAAAAAAAAAAGLEDEQRQLERDPLLLLPALQEQQQQQHGSSESLRGHQRHEEQQEQHQQQEQQQSAAPTV